MVSQPGLKGQFHQAHSW